jgi:two-component system, cell cycle sensor histidine kinase and response regulator CckA
MTNELRLLILEDTPHDAELDIAVLEDAGYSCRWDRVETRESFLECLDRLDFDIILCDFSLPVFDGLTALELFTERQIDVPFIFVSGTLGEDVAIECLKAGATDYVIKPHLSRLGPVVTRALREKNEQRKRRQAEAAIHESEERYRKIFEDAPIGIINFDAKLNILKANKAFCELLGYTEEEILNLSFVEITHLKDLQEEVELDEQVFRGVIPNYQIEKRFIKKSQEPIWTNLTATVIRDKHGNALHGLGMIRDITERMQVEQALRESEERLQAILDNSPALIYTQDTNCRFTFVNRQFETLFQVDKDQIKTRTAHDLFPKEIADSLMFYCVEVLEDKAPKEFEETIPHADGPHTYVSIRFPLYDSAHAFSGLCSISTDVTESRQLEEQLRQAQKMEAIGRLAGGVAHDFNNLLTAIIGYSQIVLGSLAPTDSLRKEVEEILKAGKRASSLTSQLLAFSRRQVLQPVVLDLNLIVGNTVKMLRRLIGEDIHLVTMLSPELGRVKIDPGQIEQVIMNLAVNARDAMPRGGKLTVETINTTLDDSYAREHISIKPGPYVMITVSDTGVGMNAETQSHIFEPFFTTKGHGLGTGLGLSMVYGIVKQSGGCILVYSEMGEGTTFKIYLPRVEEAEDAVLQRDESDYLPGGTETILLVEDEQAVRDLSARILRELGYTVIEAGNGEEAMLISDERANGDIHLLLTDVVMPQMSGRLLTDMIKAARPGIKTLFSSGYTDNALVHHGALEPGTAFLQKPFSPSALARKVREVLDKK